MAPVGGTEPPEPVSQVCPKMSPAPDYAAECATLANDAPRLTPSQVHEQHAEFVWRVLHHLGVRAPSNEDVYQEVFLVVHRRLHTFTGHSSITTWLYQICLRVTSAYRRKAHFQRESLIDDWAVIEETQPPRTSPVTPEGQLVNARRARQLESILDTMAPAYRVVFVMFDIEGLSSEEIAVITGAPLGTVYSRLHRARQQFERALNRLGPSGVEHGI